jgi:hypothetical protein
MSATICENGHVQHVSLSRGTRIADLQCSTCGGRRHMAKYDSLSKSYIPRSAKVVVKAGATNAPTLLQQTP